MPDLNTEQVRAQLASLGLSPVDGEDLEEVSHRINALREALTAIETDELDEQEPLLIFDLRGGGQ